MFFILLLNHIKLLGENLETYFEKSCTQGCFCEEVISLKWLTLLFTCEP